MNAKPLRLHGHLILAAALWSAGLASLGFLEAASAQSAVDNPHGALEYPCETCHSAEGWEIADVQARFDHDETSFALEGAHLGLACSDCHTDLRFAEVDADCSGCHIDVHRNELGDDCSFCHTTHSFLDQARLRRMHRQTRFTLTGAHAGADCESCHVPRAEGGLTYLGVSSTCVDCHRTEYESTTSPDHVASDFLETCEVCHSTATWEGGFFNHERVLGGDLVCVNCHQDDYDRVDKPDHAASNFPLQCEVCHNTRRWPGDFFAHDDLWFPIYVNRHSSEWDECVDCHTASNNFLVYDCLGCHPHSDEQKTNGDHREEDQNRYSYTSTACYDCHPRGR